MKRKINPAMPLGKYTGLVTKYYFGSLSKKLEGLGIDRHFSTLMAIEDATQKCTQQYLSDLLNFDKVSMVRMLDYLVERNMIRRTVNPSDRREHIIELTPKAEAIMADIKNGVKDFNKIAFKGITKEHRDIFMSCLGTIIGNMENLPANEVDIKLSKDK